MIGHLHMADQMHAALQHLARLFIHHRGMIGIVQKPQIGAADFLDDVQPLGGAVQIHAGMVHARIQRFQQQHDTGLLRQ